MYVRRKSNWYIYFISFGIAAVFVIVAIFAFKWYLFPSDAKSTGVNEGGTGENFRPTSEHNFIIMCMISDGVTDNPELFYLTVYNAVESRVAFVPLQNNICLDSEGRTLPNIYAAQGSSGVVKAVENEMGITCPYYIKSDRISFGDIVSAFGNVDFNLPKTVVVREDDEISTYNQGKQSLTAEDIYRLAIVADYDEGEAYRLRMAGDIFAELINQNYRNIDGNLLDTYFGMIMQYCETNLTEEAYKARKEALKYTIEYGAAPGEYYLPYGDDTNGGGFKIADNSIVTIKQKAGLE